MYQVWSCAGLHRKVLSLDRSDFDQPSIWDISPRVNRDFLFVGIVVMVMVISREGRMSVR